MVFDVASFRAEFPSLESGIAHFDNPGGTQTPRVVGEAIARTLRVVAARRRQDPTLVTFEGGRWARRMTAALREVRRADEATPHDSTVRGAMVELDRELIAASGALVERLVAVDVEGTEAYVVRDDVDALVAARPSDAVRFLPGHDQWVIGPGTKDTRVTPASARDLMTRKANPVAMAGVVCGTWARTGDTLTVTWLDERQRPDRPIEQETARLADILGRDLQLRLTS